MSGDRQTARFVQKPDVYREMSEFRASLFSARTAERGGAVSWGMTKRKARNARREMQVVRNVRSTGPLWAVKTGYIVVSVLFCVLGAVLLGIAYFMAVSIQEPMKALALFFIAVILVILATYLLFIAGSVALCRVLQRNRNYYYQPRHFVSVSSMAYRMKRNGAGLASICILATMVLVMLSSSACLYFGAEDSLKATYPREFALEVWLENSADMPKLQEALTKAGAAYGVNVWEKGTVEPGSGNTWSAAFDTGLSQEQQLALSRAIDEALGDTDITWNYFRSYRAEAADDFYGTYGSLFFIGIVLSVLFICAAVLIIYYKQLCEGYEDQPRFAIMQKVGMTAADIPSVSLYTGKILSALDCSIIIGADICLAVRFPVTFP